jgi:hypothetical protein
MAADDQMAAVAFIAGLDDEVRHCLVKFVGLDPVDSERPQLRKYPFGDPAAVARRIFRRDADESVRHADDIVGIGGNWHDIGRHLSLPAVSCGQCLEPAGRA